MIVDVEASTGEQLPPSTTVDSSYGVYIDANALPSAPKLRIDFSGGSILLYGPFPSAPNSGDAFEYTQFYSAFDAGAWG